MSILTFKPLSDRLYVLQLIVIFMTDQNIQERFQKEFQNIEVRVPVINEYHTGKIAYNAIADFWLSILAEQKAEMVKELEDRFQNLLKLDVMYEYVDKDGKRRRIVLYDDLLDLLSDIQPMEHGETN